MKELSSNMIIQGHLLQITLQATPRVSAHRFRQECLKTCEIEYLFYEFAIVLVGFHWMDGRREHIRSGPGNAALVYNSTSIKLWGF